MTPLNKILLVLGTALALWLCGAQGAETNDFSISCRQESADAQRPAYRAYLQWDDTKFAFVLPQGMMITGDEKTREVALRNRERTVNMSITLVDPAFKTSTRLKAEMFRGDVLDDHAGGKITEEGIIGANGHQCPCFNSTWRAQNRIAQCTRTVFVPTAKGLMRFSATTSPEKFPKAIDQLNLVIGTWQSTARGAIKSMPLNTNL